MLCPCWTSPDIVVVRQLPPTLIYPDEEAGNAGLCRLLVYSEVMPADEPTQEQTLRCDRRH